MKRIIVTGANGFVGANLVRHLLGAGHAVHVLVRPQDHFWRLDDIRSSIQIHEIDVRDEAGVTRSIRKIKPDWVFHLAVHGAYSWQMDLREMIQTNVGGTVNLLEACADVGIEAFVNTGSSSEYGFKSYAPGEGDWIDPNSHYAVTKAFATHYCRQTARARDLAVSTLRLYSVYGPYEDPRRLFPTLICHGLAGTLPPLASRTIARDYVHVSDVCSAYVRAASQAAKGEVYNVGTGLQTSLADLVALARSVMGIVEEPRWGTFPDREWDSTVWLADVRKIEADLGWKAALDLRAGLAETVEWFRSTPHHDLTYAVSRS